jgi:DNA-binding NtrC family response regulator
MATPDRTKTILLVDDDRAIVDFVCDILANKGYNVRIANSAEEAIRSSKEYGGEIDLLLSDFQMPKMSGVELAVELTRTRPKLKVLLMSGFPDGMLVLNEGWHFLTKPFIPSQLLALITGLLHPDHASRFSTT